MDKPITREEHGQLRAGRITGSIVQRLMTSSRGAWNRIAYDLRNPKPFFELEDTPNMPDALAWGQRHERMAAGEFWDRHPEYDVHDPKFIHWHDPTDRLRVRHFGYSPDKMLSRAGCDTRIGGLEIKCPWDGAIHVENIKCGRVPDRYRWQILWGMRVSALDEWWFVTFDPRVQDPDWRYHEIRVHPSPAEIQKMDATVSEFLDGFTMGVDFAPANPTAADFDKWF